MVDVTDAIDGGLSAELVVRSGWWHARYARVLLTEQSGDLALVLVDGNGDESELSWAVSR